VKRFQFRLAPALRLREQQLELEERRLMESRRRELEMRNLLESIRSDWRKVCNDTYASGDLPPGGLEQLGLLDHSATGLAARLRREIASCEAAVASATAGYLRAKAQVDLLLKLRDKRRTEWRQETDREEAAFVDELFLLRLPLRDSA
jgi:flagellar export protein FliJ